MKIFVTGASGFIGSHLVEKLIDMGHKVICLVEYNSTADIGNLKYIKTNEYKIEWGNIRSLPRLNEIVNNNKIELIFHLSSLISIPYSYQSPDEFIETNVKGAYNISLTAQKYNSKLIHISTSEVYGTAEYIPIDEQHPLKAQSPYSATKIGADKIIESFVRSFGTKAITIRPFNCYGERQSVRAIIPHIIIGKLKYNKVKVGNLYPIRDLIYVEDLVNALVLSIDIEEYGETYNVGTGRGYKIQDLLKIIDVDFTIDNQRMRRKESEVDKLICNYNKFNKKTGWRPKYKLEDVIGKLVKWYRNNIGDYDVSNNYGWR